MADSEDPEVVEGGSGGRSILRRLESMVEMTGSWQEEDNRLQGQQMQEQFQLMTELVAFIETSEEARHSVEHSNRILMNEKEHLQSQLATETERVDQLHKKVKTLYDVVDRHSELKEAYNSLTAQMKQGELAKNPNTESKTATSLMQLALKHAPVSWLMPRDVTQQPVVDVEVEPTINITKSEILNLSEGINALKSCIAEREHTWNKVEKKEKRHRSHLFQMGKEILTLKEAINSQRQQLEARSGEIKEKDATIDRIGAETASLSQQLIEQKTVVDEQRDGLFEQQKIIEQQHFTLNELQQKVIKRQEIAKEQEKGTQRHVNSPQSSSTLGQGVDPCVEDLVLADTMTIGCNAERRIEALVKHVKLTHGRIESHARSGCSSPSPVKSEHVQQVVSKTTELALALTQLQPETADSKSTLLVSSPVQPDLVQQVETTSVEDGSSHEEHELVRQIYTKPSRHGSANATTSQSFKSKLVPPKPVQRELASLVAKLQKCEVVEPKRVNCDQVESKPVANMPVKRRIVEPKPVKGYPIEPASVEQKVEEPVAKKQESIESTPQGIAEQRPITRGKSESELIVFPKVVKGSKLPTDPVRLGRMMNRNLRSLIEKERNLGASKLFDILPNKATHPVHNKITIGGSTEPCPVDSIHEINPFNESIDLIKKVSPLPRLVIKIPSVVTETQSNGLNGSLPKNISSKIPLNNIPVTERATSGIPVPKWSLFGNANNISPPRLSPKYTAPRSLADKSWSNNPRVVDTGIETTPSRIPQTFKPISRSSAISPASGKTGPEVVPPKKTRGRAFPFVMMKRPPSSMAPLPLPPSPSYSKTTRPASRSDTALHHTSQVDVIDTSYSVTQTTSSITKRHATSKASRQHGKSSQLVSPNAKKLRSASQPRYKKESHAGKTLTVKNARPTSPTLKMMS